MTRSFRKPSIPSSPSFDRAVVPGSRIVPDLAAAIEHMRRLGGTLVSEIRTAPGIASWAFVSGVDGQELLLWQNSR